MKNQYIFKVLYAGVFLIAVGALFLFLENMFYQYLDDDDFLHESLFMPLGAFSIILGLVCFLIFIIIKVRSYLK